MSPLLFVHIAAGAVALLAGFAAISVRKGERLHRAAGSVFFVAMLAMAGLGALIGAQMREPFAFVPGLVTLYLVVTAWGAVRRPPGQIGRFERLALAAGAGVAVVAVGFGLQAQGSSGGAAATLYVFAALAGLGAAFDLRTIRRGGLAGPARIARHLWRMCLALAIAAGSFFLGQQDEFPQALRGAHNAIPPLAVLAVMAFWLVRVRWPARRARAQAA